MNLEPRAAEQKVGRKLIPLAFAILVDLFPELCELGHGPVCCFAVKVRLAFEIRDAPVRCIPLYALGLLLCPNETTRASKEVIASLSSKGVGI